jgi:hypothetical protein
MRDSSRDGASWLNRFGSYEVEHSTHCLRREAWHRLLEDLGLQYGWVDARAVARDGVPEWVKVLVLPDVNRITPQEMEELQRFLDRGGRILGDRPGSALRSLFAHDRGVILRARMLRYLDQRRGGPGSEARREVEDQIARSGIAPPCRAVRLHESAGGLPAEDLVMKEGNVGLEVIRRPAKDGTYYFVLLNPGPAEEKNMTTESCYVLVTFPRPVRARDVFGFWNERWEGEARAHIMSGDRPWVFFVEKP